MIQIGKCWGCGGIKEVTINGGAQHCHECKPPERIKKVKKYINHQAPRRAKQNTEYLKVRRVFLIENPICQFKGCKNESDQVHHMRGRVESLLCDTRNFMACCNDHHEMIEDSPAEAMKLGYTKSRLNK